MSAAPYHPQTEGKIERWHQTLKNRIRLEHYSLPGDLERRWCQRNSGGAPGHARLVAMSNSFRYFNSSPEVIRLAVMMHVRYPTSRICWLNVGLTSATRPSGSGGTGLAQCPPPRFVSDASRTCVAIRSGVDGVEAPS
jgi:transposase InsO family protein